MTGLPNAYGVYINNIVITNLDLMITEIFFVHKDVIGYK